MRAKCKCALCGETLTAPIFFEGKIYGYTCIKIVNPTYSKSKKNKEYFVLADSFLLEKLNVSEGGLPSTKIIATWNGVKFIDYITTWKRTNGGLVEKSDSIKLVENKAYINLWKYKNGFYIPIK